jgi:nitrate/TMAO reductase-like tetraheme cytochrome c subunit
MANRKQGKIMDVNTSASSPETSASRRIGRVAWFRLLADNLMTKMGLASIAFWGLALLYFVSRDVSSNAFEANPYSGLLIYMLLPGLFWASVAFAAAGMFFRWRRLKAHPEEAVPSGRSRPIAKRAAALAFLCTILWLILSAFGAYKSYHATATTNFCGTACHVMAPEYSAFQHSFHDRINCVQCHVGTATEAAIVAKANGLRQVYMVATHTYHTPIKTPLTTPLTHILTDRSTCGECHSPDRMRGEVTRTFTHYSKDAENTPVTYKLLFNVTTGSGVHWHVGQGHKVQYFASDDALQTIPYIRHTGKDGTVSEFVTPGFDKSKLDESKLRTMNCTDCHNRVGHSFKSPSQAVSAAIDQGRVSTALPFVAREALKVFSEKYATTDEAVAKLNSSLDAFYAANPLPADKASLLPEAKAGLAEIYRENFFPEMNVDARGFNDNLGHFEFKGCERCHDAKHVTVDKTRKIEKKCDTCHTLVGQGMNADEIKKMTVGVVKFQHPDDPVSLNKSCSSCHALKKE